MLLHSYGLCRPSKCQAQRCYCILWLTTFRQRRGTNLLMYALLLWCFTAACNVVAFVTVVAHQPCTAQPPWHCNPFALHPPCTAPPLHCISLALHSLHCRSLPPTCPPRHCTALVLRPLCSASPPHCTPLVICTYLPAIAVSYYLLSICSKHQLITFLHMPRASMHSPATIKWPKCSV